MKSSKSGVETARLER